MIKKFLFFVLVSILLFSFKCADSGKPIGQLHGKESSVKDTQQKVNYFANCDTFPKINYKKIQIKSNKHLNEIFSRFKQSAKSSQDKFDYLKILRTLNRKELRFFRVGDSIVVPDTIIPNIRAYSLFPHCYPSAANIKKLIIVSNKYQAYCCYEKGRLIRFAATNTGKERTQTYPGRYALNWKEKEHRSSIDSTWVMPFTWNFHAQAGNAFHQFEMPGRPVSHSCCRQFLEDAEWLYHWGEGTKKDSLKKLIPLSGTMVILIDHFDFNRKKYGPWLDLKSNKDSAITLPANPTEVEEALIPISQIPFESRGSLRNRERFVHAEDSLRSKGVIREGVKLIETKNFNKLRQEKLKKEALKKKKEEEAKNKAEKG